MQQNEIFNRAVAYKATLSQITPALGELLNHSNEAQASLAIHRIAIDLVKRQLVDLKSLLDSGIASFDSVRNMLDKCYAAILGLRPSLERSADRLESVFQNQMQLRLTYVPLSLPCDTADISRFSSSSVELRRWALGVS